MAETADEPIEPNKLKTVLKASIHCEGCKRKVKKILTQVHGVESVDVDTKQQKVTVTGNVDADTLIKKLVKSGKHAQLWPQNPHKTNNNNNVNFHNGKIKEKLQAEEETPTKTHHQPPKPTSDNAVEEPQPVESPAKSSQGSVGPPEGGAAKSKEENSSGDSGGPAAVKVTAEAPVKMSGGACEETKSKEENKKSEEGCSSAGGAVEKKEATAAVEKTNGGGGEGGSGTGTSGKKKKKKGQSGNLPASAPSSAFREPENQESGAPHQTNHNFPRNHNYPPPHHYYTPPPQPQPVYAVSYNTAYPTSSYTASYYAPPPPYSYAYMHPGPETVPPPSDPDLHPRQPLDSFEMFSDENPNGCFIM